MNILTTIPAHFDGKEIRLDVPVNLQPNTRLLVTILETAEGEHHLLVRSAMAASKGAFAQLWENDEDAVYDDI